MTTQTTAPFACAIAAMLAFAGAPPLAAQSAPAPALGGQASAGIANGTSIVGSDGKEIGTVAGTRGDMVYLQVGERTIPVASAAISQGANGPTIATTRGELVSQFDAQLAAYEAKLNAAVKEGAEVRTADNQALGQIVAVADEAVRVDGSDGPVTLPRMALALDRAGTVRVRATMEQIEQAKSQAPESR